MDMRFDNVPNSDEPIKAFVAACNNMCDAKFLLSEKRISETLRTIAAYPKLCDIFRNALSGYNRQAEFVKSKTKVGGRSKLVPPQNQTKFIAYVFCILMEIDTGKRQLREFLDEYFYHTNPNEEFAFFCSALIVPFRDVTEFVFYNGADSYLEDEAVDMTLRDTVKMLLAEMNTVVSQSVNASAETKQDLYMMARAIESSLTPNRIDLVKPLLTGYKNTVNSCLIREQLNRYVDKLFRVFTDGDIF